MDRVYDLIIIGSGPAGMTAAIYACRAGLSVLIIELGAPGGKLIKTNAIENYPSVIKMQGADLAYAMYEHMNNFKVENIFDEVVEVADKEVYKKVTCKNAYYLSKTVIIATGTKERLLNIDGEKQFVGKGVSYCAVCDGFFFKDKTVCVIGGGNSALEEALYLSELAAKVYIVIRRDSFRADAIVCDKVKNNPKIEVIYKHVPVKINGDDKVYEIILEDVENKNHTSLKVEGIFPYIGADPCTEFVSKLDILDKNNYIVTNAKMETKIPGIYGAGDCIVKDLRQVITACSDGAIAAQSAYHYIKDKISS